MVLGSVAALTGAVMITGLVEGNLATAETSPDWDTKPVIVNIQVDLEQEGDQITVFNILDEIERYNDHATVFISGEFVFSHSMI